jgi:23S rRNA U2552 (ribose-2'-O)-methylase RlmE/FtsJ
MKSPGFIFYLKPVDQDLVKHYLRKNKTYSNEELIKEKNILNSSYADQLLINELFEAKIYLEKNLFYYKQFRNSVIPNTYKFEGKHYKYHTYIKLIQSFMLCGINIKSITSFYDICGAPGEWVRSILKECPIRRAYAISLYEKGIPFDKEIYSFKKLKIISPKDGNIYKIENLEESLSCVKKVDLVCCDGDMSVSHLKNESLQALAHIHLIFAEFVYGLCFTKVKTGIFICKVFDLFDDITVQILMCATLFYKKTYIVKPKESRLVNSEKYLICQELEFNDDKDKLRNKLINILVDCKDSNPGEIFEKKFLKNDSIKNFKESLIKLNNQILRAQTNEIYRVVNLCIKKYKKI